MMLIALLAHPRPEGFRGRGVQRLTRRLGLAVSISHRAVGTQIGKT
jgi:hypothetical protein